MRCQHLCSELLRQGFKEGQVNASIAGSLHQLRIQARPRRCLCLHSILSVVHTAHGNIHWSSWFLIHCDISWRRWFTVTCFSHVLIP